MSFNYDTTGVKEKGAFDPVPEADYFLKIGKKEVKKSGTGHPMVNVELTVSEGEFVGRKMWHNVTFMPKDMKGAGMAKHWLHAIGQPYEGKITVEPMDWEGVIKAKVGIEEYKGKNQNTLKEIYIPEGESSASGLAGEPAPAEKAAAKTAGGEEQCPF